MRNGAKGCSQIKEDENGQQSGVSCHEKVNDYFYQGRFCSMEGVEKNRLEFTNMLLPDK